MGIPNLGAKYWDSRYVSDEIGWDIGYPSTPLKEYIDTIENKNLKILIPGAGNAYEAEYLVQQGFKNVWIVDISKEACSRIKKRIPSLNEKQIINKDFFDFEGQFDLILEQTFFCALNPKMREAYTKKMHELLNPNGLLVGLLFQKELFTDHPPFGGFKEDYLPLFSQHFDVQIMETAYNSIPPRQNFELFIKIAPK